MNKSKKANIYMLALALLLIIVIIVIMIIPGKKETKSQATPTNAAVASITPAITEEALKEEEVSEIELTSPVFSLTDYYYTTNQVLKITSPVDKAGEIYYTLDGSEPTKESTKYTDAGISLKALDKQLVLKKESFYKYEHDESLDVNGYIVKAKIFYEDGSVSPTRVHSYLLNSKITTRYENYVLCISGEPNDLTDSKSGILAGASGDRGKNSERTAYAELLGSDGTLLFSQYIGIRPYGGASRGSVVKSFKMYARKDAGSDIGKFNVPEDLFGTEASDGSIIDSYDKLVVRAGGNDMNFGFLRDEMNQTLMRMDGYPVTEASIPVVVYVNGEYYGILWLHENYCDDYLKELFPNESATGEFIVLEGSDTSKSAGSDPDTMEQTAMDDYEAIYKKYAYSDLTDDTIYEELRSKIDVENYLDYFAFNIYIANNDWPNNNYKCYRYMPGENEAIGEGVYDGRWRYLPHDMDFGQYLYYNNDRPSDTDSTTGAANNSVARVCDTNDKKYAPLFAELMKREDCREYFIGKIISLGTTTLSEGNVRYVMNQFIEKQEDELERYIPLLCKLGRNEWWPSVNYTKENYKMIIQFHNERLEYLLTYFEEDYGYTRAELMAMAQ